MIATLTECTVKLLGWILKYFLGMKQYHWISIGCNSIKDYDEATIMYGGNKDTMDYFYDTKAKYCEYGFWGEFYRDAGWLLTEDDNDFVSIETFC